MLFLPRLFIQSTTELRLSQEKEVLSPVSSKDHFINHKPTYAQTLTTKGLKQQLIVQRLKLTLLHERDAEVEPTLFHHSY